MKVAIAAAPRVHLLAWPRPAEAAIYRMVGLLIAVGAPTLFWTLALLFVTNSVGIAIGTPASAAFGLIVAAWCLASASRVMGELGYDTVPGSRQVDEGM
jgi:hypothetical protein